MRRRERRRRELEDTVRFPRFRRGRGGVVVGEREIGTVGNPIVVDDSDESSEEKEEEEEEQEAVDSIEEMEDEMESMEDDTVEPEVQDLRCGGSSVDLESVLKHLETSLKWKMQYGIWQKS